MKNIFTISLIFTTIVSYSQTFVSTTPENKNVVLEEFTGIACTYCPDGHRIANDIYNNNPADVVLINIHTGVMHLRKVQELILTPCLEVQLLVNQT